MKRVITIGEALIDFIPETAGLSLKDVNNFHRAPGGAPANVACCVSKLGGKSAFIGKLGQDAFGDFLIETLKNEQVDISYIYQTSEANTALAFVSLKKDGNRDFSFYRSPSSDMLLNKDEIKEEWFNNDILHFCSVDLIEAPVKYAHIKAIELVHNTGGIISFDPNVRLPLWKSKEECRQTILEFIPKANILKISDEELLFITQTIDVEEGIKSLFKGNVELILYTQGSLGATLYSKDLKVSVNGFKIDAIDTTGAGDAFIGAFLFLIATQELDISSLTEEIAKELLVFSNAVGALTTSKKGAINSLPTLSEVMDFLSVKIS